MGRSGANRKQCCGVCLSSKKNMTMWAGQCRLCCHHKLTEHPLQSDFIWNMLTYSFWEFLLNALVMWKNSCFNMQITNSPCWMVKSACKKHTLLPMFVLKSDNCSWFNPHVYCMLNPNCCLSNAYCCLILTSPFFIDSNFFRAQSVQSPDFCGIHLALPGILLGHGPPQIRQGPGT